MSGSAKIRGMTIKGQENAAIAAINRFKKSNLGEGKYLLATSLGSQGAFSTIKRDKSIFTFYILEGLKGGNGESLDNNGDVTQKTRDAGAFSYLSIKIKIRYY